MLHVATAVTQTHNFLLASDHFEATRHWLGNHKVKAVRANVQCRDEFAHSKRR
jgi:hypothetical protein